MIRVLFLLFFGVALARSQDVHVTSAFVTTVTNSSRSSSLTNVTGGLIGWWKFDEGSGTTTADEIGSMTGTLQTGSAWLIGEKKGNSITNNGSGSVDMGSSGLSVAYSNGFTATTWVNLSGVPGVDAGLFDRIGPAPQRGFVLNVNTSRQIDFEGHEAYPNDLGSWSYLITSNSIPADQWVHVAAVWKSSDFIKIYTNGVLMEAVASGILPTWNLNTGTSLVTVKSLTGAQDEVRIYNRALDAAEVDLVFRYDQ